MSSDHKGSKPQEDLEPIRQRRMQTLIGVWNCLINERIVSEGKHRLSTPLLNEVIEHYLADRHVLKIRYHIDDRIQVYKVAGLMTAAIMRYRPVVPIVDEFNIGSDVFANEILALYSAIAICAEHSEKDYLAAVVTEEWFNKWLREMIYFLHFRNYTAESLCMIFMTIMQLRFPDVLHVEKD